MTVKDVLKTTLARAVWTVNFASKFDVHPILLSPCIIASVISPIKRIDKFTFVQAKQKIIP